MDFAERMYDLSRDFSNFEILNWRQDLTRAATSISLNVIRGSNALSREDCRKVLWTAFTYLDEVMMFLAMAQHQKYISEDAYHKAYAECEQMSKVLSDFTHELTSQTPSLN